MSYRNGTYVAFDGNGTINPTQGDMKYYGLLQKWNTDKRFDLNFSDSHKKTYQVNDSSQKRTLEQRLLERMRNSKNMLLIVSEDTNWDRGMLNFEIEKAVDYYKMPIIIAYTGYAYILNPIGLEKLWPKALYDRIKNNTAKCIHIPFKEVVITAAISQFSVHNEVGDMLNSPMCTYSEESYRNWRLL
ncbi:TIR domain-containing protein [Clostridioides sp. ZZV14-6153]|uniref:TIR domain-containing protein n=1 Tax=Clostridioides sp. ZZV14-6153 TaxID=2811494 RepID=UPI001D113751|nr:hypothetical protein [Clostridioides sp. ZZV14-6153]